MNFSALIGKTLTAVNIVKGDDRAEFTADNGDRFALLHIQDCCENVSIEDVCGDPLDIIGSPILIAEEVSGETAEPSGWSPGEYTESYTWTFYKIDTAKGGITIRWLGESNGYYSESVDFCQLRGGGSEIRSWDEDYISDAKQQ